VAGGLIHADGNDAAPLTGQLGLVSHPAGGGRGALDDPHELGAERALGGGGLGDLAIRYGYQRFRPDIMIATVVILIVLVQIVQFLGNRLANGLNKK